MPEPDASNAFMILAMLNMWEVVALIAVVLIIFGAKKLPELARGMGQGIKEFKKASKDEPPDDDLPTKPA